MKSKALQCNILILLLLTGLTPLLQARKLSIFAEENNGEIQGTAYFYGGGKAKGIKINFYDRNGKLYLKTKSEADGSFAGKAPSTGPVRLEADGGDGQKVEYIVELPASQALEDNGDQETAKSRTEEKGHAVTAAEIRKIISDELSTRITPLRHEIEKMDDSVFFRDIVSGICLIIGIFGTYAYFAARKKRSK